MFLLWLSNSSQFGWASHAWKLTYSTDGTPVLADGKTAAMEEQLEAKEAKMIEYEKREYLA